MAKRRAAPRKHKPVKPAGNGENPVDIELSNGAMIHVTPLTQMEQMRSIAAFGDASLDKADNGEELTQDEAMDIFHGNDKYMMYILDLATELLSPMPAASEWLPKYRRNAAFYGVDVDELDDPDYVKSVYIRFVAMDSEDEANLVRAALGTYVESEPVPEEDEDESDVQAVEAEAD